MLNSFCFEKPFGFITAVLFFRYITHAGFRKSLRYHHNRDTKEAVACSHYGLTKQQRAVAIVLILTPQAPRIAKGRNEPVLFQRPSYVMPLQRYALA